jgi:hypothetical protein
MGEGRGRGTRDEGRRKDRGTWDDVKTVGRGTTVPLLRSQEEGRV